MAPFGPLLLRICSESRSDSRYSVDPHPHIGTSRQTRSRVPPYQDTFAIRPNSFADCEDRICVNLGNELCKPYRLISELEPVSSNRAGLCVHCRPRDVPPPDASTPCYMPSVSPSSHLPRLQPFVFHPCCCMIDTLPLSQQDLPLVAPQSSWPKIRGLPKTRQPTSQARAASK